MFGKPKGPTPARKASKPLIKNPITRPKPKTF